MYNHLIDYYKNLNQYIHLLQPGKPRKLAIQKEEIPDYVMQRRNHQGYLISFKHLAVREVKIFCTFQNPDVGNITLVDIPGLGDSRLGDEDLMLNTLGQAVDIVLFLRRPDSLRYQWNPKDTELYDKASEALNNLSQRAFMILNHSRRTDNFRACERLKNTLNTIEIVRCEITDCSNPEEANRVFDIVLDYLANNIEALDRDYALSCQSEIFQLHNDVNSELEKAHVALGNLTENEVDNRLFVIKFNQLWGNIRNELTELLQKLRQNREEVDIDFEAQVKATLEACRKDTRIPSIEDIKRRNNQVQGYGITYESYLNEIRAHLSQHFLSLDDGLKRSLERVKSLVANVLIEKGHLGELTEARGSEFIQAIAQQIHDELIPEQPSKLKFGFQMLADFELSYRGLIQHRIRKHLDVLTPPDEFSQNDSVKPLPNSPTAERVLQLLKTAHEQAVYKCEEPLEHLFSEPSQAAFAIVEEFLDRVLRAADVESEWRIFLYEKRSLIWTEFQQLHEQAQMRREWQNAVDEVKAANQVNLMQFL